MLVTSTGSGTEVEIRYASLDEIHDVDFLNEQSPGWCRWVLREREIGEGFYPGERTFTAENIARVEEWLAVPLYRGWTEDAFYLRGKHVMSKLRWKQGDKVVQTTEYMQHVGCLLSLFQAIYYSARLGGRRMQSRTIVVKPMIEAV